MPQRAKAVLKPRKMPVQARSTASVTAILDATLQVLVSVGKERLTTTRVALRAGVSVGTLYQYFPNKSALLQAALIRHLDEVTSEVERVSREHHGQSLEQMVTQLMNAFLLAKMKNPRASVALYAVSSDVDGAKIGQQKAARNIKSIVEMLESAEEPLARDPKLMASMLQGAMAGVSRRLLESAAPEKHLEPLRQELVFFACSYVEACAERNTPRGQVTSVKHR